jgi:hypothetical protein
MEVISYLVSRRKSLLIHELNALFEVSTGTLTPLVCRYRLELSQSRQPGFVLWLREVPALKGFLKEIRGYTDSSRA